MVPMWLLVRGVEWRRYGTRCLRLDKVIRHRYDRPRLNQQPGTAPAGKTGTAAGQPAAAG